MTEPIPESQARNLSALQMAFIGDAVYNLAIRLQSLREGKNLQAMHLGTTRRVNAVAQAEALNRISGHLNDEEMEIVRRGRNAHARHSAPRSATSAQYSASTGFEALIGYHYLTGQHSRLNELLSILSQPQAPKQETK